MEYSQGAPEASERRRTHSCDLYLLMSRRAICMFSSLRLLPGLYAGLERYKLCEGRRLTEECRPATAGVQAGDGGAHL